MSTNRSARLAVSALVCALVAGACGGSYEDDAAQAGPGGGARLTGELKGAGSTFQKTFDDEAINAFRDVQAGVTVTYGEPKGSGAGRTALADQLVDFAGTDGVVKQEDLGKFKGGALLYVPTVSAPITVSYDLPGVDALVLDGPTLAKVFTGAVTTWDDPAIVALNGSTTLPPTKIVPVVRQDSSGTTENFTKYLASASPSTFTVKPGGQPEWPAAITTKSPGNSGVAGSVKSTEGAIGYVDLADAKSAGLRFAAIRNKAGKPVLPTVESAEAAVAAAAVKEDLTYDPLDAAGEAAYPITAPTWILVYAKQPNADKAALLRAFLSFVLRDGQDLARRNDYAPLPAALAERARAQVAKIG
jgi:phosphate transport system substrate-binding protein